MSWNAKTDLLYYFSIAGALLLGSCDRQPSRPQTRPASKPRVNKDEVTRLVRAIDGMRTWPTDTDPDFTAQDWHRAICVARMPQGAEPAAARKALDESADYKRIVGEYSPSRAFVVLRLMFDLPENAPADRGDPLVSAHGWFQYAPRENGRVSLTWPISWYDGQPRFVFRLPGFKSGPPYRPNTEYDSMRGKYLFRDLSAWACDSDETTTQSDGGNALTGTWPASASSSQRR